MPNQLSRTNSPYLLQHADNPVDWHPWDAAALEKARREDKPIFLSIGYAACHWCHVMAHESFEDPATAAIMNEHFVNIKVDREERPDLDGIYMQAVVAITGQGGWPLSVFLTPEGKPFHGGTYFPPERRYNLPAFRELLAAIARLWREERSRLLENSAALLEHLQQHASASLAGGTLTERTLDDAALALAQGYDWQNGGWGRAPKFPQPMAIEFLLRRAVRGDNLAREMAMHALHAMAKGGMYDLVGGGFARYSVDALWLVPHFEKMLYDNAQLAQVYLHAYQLTGEAAFRQVCERTLDFILRELSHPQGGFFSSLDADSEGEEGKFYLWTLAEVRAAIPQAADADLLIAAYDLSEEGNFEGSNVLQRARTDDELAQQFHLPAADVPARLEQLHAKLLAARGRRIRPGTDDKVLTMWNALALAALAEGGQALHRPDYLAAARRNARFLLTQLHPPGSGRLLRSWRAGSAQHNGYLEDYAALILGLLALYQADADPGWFARAVSLAEEMIANFADPAGGFFDTRADHEPLLIRPKDTQDNATPSGNALAAEALLLLAALDERSDWQKQAESMLAGMQAEMARYPTAFARWLSAADFALGPVTQVAILGDPADPQTRALAEAAGQGYQPRRVLALASFPPPQDAPLLLKDRPLLGDQPTAYVCHGFVCRQPVTTVADLLAEME